MVSSRSLSALAIGLNVNLPSTSHVSRKMTTAQKIIPTSGTIGEKSARRTMGYGVLRGGEW